MQNNNIGAYQCLLNDADKQKEVFIWQVRDLKPFDELIISWNARRPHAGAYLLQASLYTSEWSPWIDYAYWGSRRQHTFKENNLSAFIKNTQDVLTVSGITATGFKARVIAQENASLKTFRAMYASPIDRRNHAMDKTTSSRKTIKLDLQGISQFSSPSEYNPRICSPASMTSVLRYLQKQTVLTHIDFADQVWDSNFDIFGNWILNIAQASHILGENWRCAVAHFHSFDQIYDLLQDGLPVVVSVKGPLSGSALPYSSGHLLAVKGYDAEKRAVICMDPAFPENDLTHVEYPLEDFLNAWSRRSGITYVFVYKCML